MEKRQQICILGSTGSIGTQALEVIEEHSDLYEVYCLTANNRVNELAAQARKFHPAAVVIANEAHYSTLQSLLADEPDIKVYATVATAWDGVYHDAARTEQLCNQVIEGMKNTAQPETKVVEIDEEKIQETGLIDVSLPDVDDNIHSLTSLKGQVVLLDFTMYGGPYSKERIRQMRSIYEKYASRGFQIYQISLDDDLSFWRYQSENLPWICVHETNGTATKVYGVNTLPTYFLINRANEVVKRSDTINDVEKEIEALL